MQYVVKPVYIDAIQFKYSKEGIKTLQDFTNGNVTRHGAQRLPTMGGFAYVRIDDKQILVVDDGDYVIKWLNTNEYDNMPEKEFLEKFDPIDSLS